MRTSGSGFLRIISFLLVLSFLILSLTSCSKKASDQRPKAKKQYIGRMALILKTLNNPYFIKMEEAAKRTAEKYNIELMVQAPEREIDVERQITITENFIEMGVDVIAIAPSGSKEIIPAIKKANKAGIPVIIVDTRIDEEEAKRQGAEYVTFIGSDNYEGGRIAGKYVAERLNGKGEVAILEGIPGHETADQRKRGFVDEISKYPGIKIVASQPANWEMAMAFDVTQNILTAHPELDAIFACNDMMALGALQAVQQARKLGQIVIVGFDAIEDAVNEIKAGRLDASVAQFPDEMGEKAVEVAYQIIKARKEGKPISQLGIPKEIPTTIALITKDNVDKFLSGELLKELKAGSEERVNEGKGEANPKEPQEKGGEAEASPEK